MYGDRDITFHLSIHVHPEVEAMGTPVLAAVWGCVVEQPLGGRVDLVAACLMPDHLHLLMRPRDMDVLRFLNTFKSWTTRLAWKAGHRGPLWQPGMWDRTVYPGRDFDETLRYVVGNPVAAGLVDDPADWPWTWVAPMEA